MYPKTKGPIKSAFDVFFIGVGLWIAMPICAGFYRNYEHIQREELEADI